MNISQSVVNFHVALELRRLLSAFPFERKKIEELQLKKLRRLLIRACNDHEFYRERVNSCGLDPRKLQNVEELQKMPVLTEAEYREFSNAEYEKNPSRYKSFFFDHTSGTVGTQFIIVRSWPERAYMIAKFLRTLFLNGLRWNDRILRIVTPTRIPERKDSLLQHFGLFKRTFLSFHSSAEEMALAFQDFQPDFFYANKQQLLMTACYLLENDLTYQKPRLYSACADIIEENCRQLLYQTFGRNNMFETYGCNEIGNLGFQLKSTEGLHFCHDTEILELQDKNGSAARDEGNCLITDLGISSFPLIRFQLGDFLETYEDEYGVRRIRKIWGRLHDWLTWEDGTRTHFSEFFKIMELFSSEICQFQIIQKTPESIHILAVSVPGSDTSGSRKESLTFQLVSLLKKNIRQPIDYSLEFVKSIPAGKNGKVKMVISELNS